MSDTERDAFLAEPGILMRVATVDSEGRPLVVPIWFIHRYYTPNAKMRDLQRSES